MKANICLIIITANFSGNPCLYSVRGLTPLCKISLVGGLRCTPRSNRAIWFYLDGRTGAERRPEAHRMVANTFLRNWGWSHGCGGAHTRWSFSQSTVADMLKMSWASRRFYLPTSLLHWLHRDNRKHLNLYVSSRQARWEWLVLHPPQHQHDNLHV